jgi:hypothetical protein
MGRVAHPVVSGGGTWVVLTGAGVGGREKSSRGGRGSESR